jgi:hypothetical protein
LEVKAFTDEEGLSFVRTKLPPERISDPQALELLGILHNLPLATAQAVAYLVNCTGITATEYKSIITKTDLSVSTHGLLKNHSEILPTTQVSFKYIQNMNPQCASLAEIISMFGFQSIPVSVLRLYNKNVDDLRDLLTKFALINVPIDRTPISMNPLVQSSIKYLVVDKNSLVSEILMVLSNSFLSLPPGKTDFPATCMMLNKTHLEDPHQ